jgi:hypothetical protein
MAQPASDSPVVRLVTRILPRHKRLGNEIVIAAFGGTQDRVQHAADELDATDDEPVDGMRVEFVLELDALPPNRQASAANVFARTAATALWVFVTGRPSNTLGLQKSF